MVWRIRVLRSKLVFQVRSDMVVGNKTKEWNAVLKFPFQESSLYFPAEKVYAKMILQEPIDNKFPFRYIYTSNV
jgi:hypothetical protein